MERSFSVSAWLIFWHTKGSLIICQPRMWRNKIYLLRLSLGICLHTHLYTRDKIEQICCFEMLFHDEGPNLVICLPIWHNRGKCPSCRVVSCADARTCFCLELPGDSRSGEIVGRPEHARAKNHAQARFAQEAARAIIRYRKDKFEYRIKHKIHKYAKGLIEVRFFNDCWRTIKTRLI